MSLGEPLEGSAVDGIDTWVLLEYARPWEPKPLAPSELPAAVKARVESWVAEPGCRHQFIRRPACDAKHPILYLAHTRPDRPWVLRFELDRYEDLLGLDLKEIVREGSHAGGRLVGEPVHLVCAHGRRDRCCGQKGSALFRALATGSQEHIWQTSHLGGHRFAACVLSLPHGIYYGRLGDEHGVELVRAHQAGELLDLEHVRGRTAWSQPVQAAEIFLRRRLEDRLLDGWTFESLETTQPNHSVVSFNVRGAQYRVVVDHETLAITRPASCGAEPEPVTRFVEAS